MLGLIAIPLIAVGLFALAGFADDDTVVVEDTDTDTPPDEMPEVPREDVVEDPPVARTPQDLLTAFDSDGTEIADDEILQERRVFSGGTEGGIIIDGSTASEVSVEGDPISNFIIVPGSVTEEINIRLNTSVDASPSEIVEVRSFVEGGIETEPGQFTEPYNLTRQSLQFERGIDINITVSQADIDTINPFNPDAPNGFSQGATDFTNPASNVHFEFADDVTGEMHLAEFVYDGGSDGTFSSREDTYLYVIQAPSDASAQNDGRNISSLISEFLLGGPPDPLEGFTTLGFFHLGAFGSTYTNGIGDEPDERIVYSFFNSDPDLTANVPWASFTRIEV